jgi:hypothetical protein
MWMVYSRDTTSAMAERPLFFPLVVLDIAVIADSTVSSLE